jgi:hypothetical protein
MADFTLQDLTGAFTKALENRGLGKSGGGGGFASSSSTSNKPIDFTGAGLKDLPGQLKVGLEGFAAEIKDSLDVWRGLSRTGANFSNDLIGLSTSAANSRMELGDFADVISKNNKNFAGLGGSVSAGSKAFADFSKGFFDSKMDLQFRELGYTTKEMNEVLAMQIGNTRASTALDKDGRDRQYEAAATFAREMDMTSKLMGKSREEQMEKIKLAQSDTAVQSKLRLEAQKMREEGVKAKRDPKVVEAEIATYQDKINKSIAKAALEGQGQLAKDLFTGVMTKTGGLQAAISGKGAGAIAEEQRALRRGDADAAQAASQRATAEALTMANNKQVLALTAAGSAAGDLEEPLKSLFTETRTLSDAVESIAIARGMDLKDAKQNVGLIKEARDKIAADKAAADKSANKGVVDGALAVERGAQEIKAGLFNAASAITEGGGSVAGALNKTGKAIADSLGIIEGTNKKSLAAQIGIAAGASGVPREPLVKRPGQGQLAHEQEVRDRSGGLVGDVTQGASKLANKTADALDKGLTGIAEAVKMGPISPIPVKITDVKAKAGGGFVPGPEINLLGEKGPEWVLNKEQMGKTLEDAARAGVEQASSMMPKMPSGGSAGLNLADMSKTITKSFSSVSGGAEHVRKSDSSQPLTQQANTMLGMGKINLKDDQKSVFDEQIKLTGKAAKDKLELIKTEANAASATNKEVSKARDAIEEKYENEGRLGELAKDKEFNRLTEQLNVSAKLSDSKKAELKAALQAEDTKTNAEKIGVKLRVDEVKNYTEHQKEVLATTKGHTQEMNRVYGDSAKDIATSIRSDIEERNGDIKALEEKASKETLSVREKGRLERNKSEVTALKERALIQDENAEVYLTSANEQKKAAEASAKAIVASTDATIKSTDVTEKAKTDISAALPVDRELRGMKEKAAANEPQSVDRELRGMKEKAAVKPLSASAAGANQLMSSWFEPKNVGTDLKAAGATIPAEAAAATSRSARDAKDNLAAKAAAAPTQTPAAGTHAATLNDVVKSLERLNIQMGHLINQNETIGRQQTKAIKSNSANGYDRTSA